MSVLICVPTYETIMTECYKALWELDDCGHDLYFDAVKGYDCARARIKCCEKALDMGTDWLLMVDSDTVVPHDALANMVADDVDLCLGYYQYKSKPEGETCLWKPGAWGERFRAAELRALAERGMVAVHVQGGGMGCALVRASMLRELPRPWFKWVVTADGVETGEDVFFCDLARAHGFGIFADARVACGHVYAERHDV